MKKGLTILGLLAFAIPLAGQSRPPAPRFRPGGQVAEMVSAVFKDSDRRAIHQWVQGLSVTAFPPGLAKRGDLSPQARKQLRKNGTLPAGMEKSVSPFPDDLTKRLEPLPAACGCDRVFLDGKALIVARATSQILDAVDPL